MSIRCLLVSSKRQLKKDIFLSSFYGCLFKTKSRLKDMFPFCRKDSLKKIKSLIREQYAAPPLDECDIVKFLVNKNYTG